MKNIHFIGIGGIGLSALAQFLHAEGYHVTGSDLFASSATKLLRAKGIDVAIGHSAQNIAHDTDLVIYSAVVKPENAEFAEAMKRGIKTLPRRDSLAFILANKSVYATCGAHGKSTTTAMLSAVLRQSTAIIGAESKAFKSNMRYVASELLVFEADESDSSFLNSNPYCAIVTNAEPEHLEYYKYDLEKFYGAYREFLLKAKYRVINAEDEFLRTLDIDATRLYPSKDISQIEYILIDNQPFTRFRLKDLGLFEVWGFGEHIALDASLAILAGLHELDIETIRQNLRDYKGIKKRFDVVGANESITIIDDYAHHPTEVEATIESVEIYNRLKGNGDEVIVIWQPHKYSRTLDNLEHFQRCFKGCDRLVILPVWSAGEVHEAIDFETLFSQYNPIFADSVKNKQNCIALIQNDKVIRTIEKGIVVGVGAGDITYQMRGEI